MLLLHERGGGTLFKKGVQERQERERRADLNHRRH